MKWLWSSWRKHWKLKPKLTYIHHLCVYQRWVRVVDLQRKAVSPCGADCHEVWWQITHITKQITKASLVLIKVYTWRVKERVRERDKKLEREREKESLPLHDTVWSPCLHFPCNINPQSPPQLAQSLLYPSSNISHDYNLPRFKHPPLPFLSISLLPFLLFPSHSCIALP